MASSGGSCSAGAADVSLDALLEKAIPLSWDEVHHGPAPKLEALPFKLAQVPGLGIGMVATRSIRKGELILAEKQAMCVLSPVTKRLPLLEEARRESPDLPVQELVAKISMASLKDEPQEDTVKNVFAENLTDEVREAIMQLSDNYEEEPGKKTLYGIFRTNSIGVPNVDEALLDLLGEDIGNSAIFIILSRMNHACTPTVHSKLKPDDGNVYMECHAVRDIVAGEHLTLCYCKMMQTAEERRKQLSTTWQFECACQVCLLPEAELTKSDGRRRVIDNLLQKLKESTKASSDAQNKPVKAMELQLKLLLKNLEEEKLGWILTAEGVSIPCLSVFSRGIA